jgi:hypothetical protein
VQGARHAAEVPRAARGAEAVQGAQRAAAAAQEERRAGAGPGAQHVAAVRPGAPPVALPSGGPSVFRRDPLRRLAPSQQARFARATARLRSASRSRQSWQAARDEGWS